MHGSASTPQYTGTCISICIGTQRSKHLWYNRHTVVHRAIPSSVVLVQHIRSDARCVVPGLELARKVAPLVGNNTDSSFDEDAVH